MRARLVLVLLSVVACKGGDTDGKSAAPKVAEPTIDATVTFDRATFCNQVFPRAAVAKALSIEMADGQVPDAGQGRMACQHQAVGEREPPLLVTMRVDCTAPAGTYDQRALVAKMASEDHGHEDVALGRGGAKIYQPRFQSRFLAFGHAELPCAITLETEGADRDYLEPLAAMVAGKLTSSNRPR